MIDREILFIGSYNITDNSNRETGACVTGSAAFDVLNIFEKLWDKINKGSLKYYKQNDAFNSSSLVRVNYSRKIRKATRQDLCQRISSAKKRVWITNAYFVPPPRMLKAILEARNKGKDVEIIVPANPKPRFMKFITETYYRGLLAIGVKFFKYQNDFLHAKSLLVDDWAIVGSSNMNYRSFFNDLEIDIVLTHADSVLSLEEQFAVDRNNSKQITLESLVNRPVIDRIISWILHFLRYLM